MSLNKKDLETKGIKANFILEIIGRPPEHLVSTLEEIIKQQAEKKIESRKRFEDLYTMRKDKEAKID